MSRKRKSGFAEELKKISKTAKEDKDVQGTSDASQSVKPENVTKSATSTFSMYTQRLQTMRGGLGYSKTKDGAYLESAEEEVGQSASTLGQRRSGLS